MNVCLPMTGPEVNQHPNWLNFVESCSRREPQPRRAPDEPDESALPQYSGESSGTLLSDKASASPDSESSTLVKPPDTADKANA